MKPQNLYAALRKPVRTVLCGRLSILKVRLFDSFGEDAFQVAISPAPPRDPFRPHSFTSQQNRASTWRSSSTIHRFNRQAPAESDLQRYFQVSPPSVHEMIKTLERNGLIERAPKHGPFDSWCGRSICRHYSKRRSIGHVLPLLADSGRKRPNER
jgi:hypothetical protein